MYSSQAEGVKEYLKAYVKNEAVIDELLEKLRTMRAKAMSVGAQELNAMPGAPIKTKDPMAEYMVKVDELEREINRRIEDQRSSKRAIEEVLKRMESQKQTKIIRCRYIYGMEWSDVIFECYHEKKDYQEKYRAYQKRVYRDHDRALLEMARKWSMK